MLFRDIPGQEAVKKKLIHTVTEGRISHAQLFYGPEGSGKLALALAYARYINCDNKNGSDSCGTCHSCIKYNKYIHPDLHFAYPSVSVSKKDDEEETGETNQEVNLHEKWREALLENPYMDQYQWYERIGIENKQGLIGTKESSEIIRKLSLKSYESDYKILIMWLPERMNAYSANKLLKIIEEPPPYTLFLLVSENYSEILPTILSRTQMVKIPSMKDEDIKKALLEKENVSQAIAEDAVHLANGNFNRALSAIRPDENNQENFNRFVVLMRCCYAINIADILNWVEDISALGRERQKLFLTYGLRMLRENYLLHLQKNEITHMTAYENEWSQKFFRFIHNENIQLMYDEFNKAYHHIAANSYSRIVLLDMCLHIYKLLR